MGVQQSPMWQQPAPQSSSSTNPFAAPSGPSVRDCCSLNKFSLPKSVPIYSWAMFVSSSLTPTHIFSLFSFLVFYLRAWVTQTYSTLHSFSSSLSRSLVVVDELVKNDLFTFAYIFLEFCFSLYHSGKQWCFYFNYFSRRENKYTSYSSILLSLFSVSFWCTCAL